METQLGDIFHTRVGSRPTHHALQPGPTDPENFRRAVVRIVPATLLVLGGISAPGTLGVDVPAVFER